MELLDKINGPQDLKKLSLQELETLSGEIRQFLIESVSKTGGHLASNLGVVELTAALFKVFDFPDDKIIWDVGHQAYVYKILTGRKDRFDSLRKYGGLSGYPKINESPYDCFGAGHSSTSISAALGFAVSRDLKKEKNHVLAVIGDGSMTGGLAFEALNNAGRSETDLIVILNDNEMSISKNVGAVSRHLNTIRTAPSYLGAKRDVNRFLKGIPWFGEKVGRFIERTKDSIKYFFISGVLFEELGFTYIGPIDGHNIQELTDVFEKAKRIGGPLLIHVYTKKGKGYPFAEKRPEYFHGVDRFDVLTGKSINAKSKNTYSAIFGDELTKIAGENEKVVAITASMPAGTGLNNFQKNYPDRVFDVGIAEGHAVTFAAGMARNGLLPVFAVYSSFLQRSYDQLLHDVCLQNLPVVFAIDRAGIVGADGETHQGIFDLSYLSHIPNLTVMAPRNGFELRQMLRFAFALGTPAAIRYPKGGDSDVFPDSKPPVRLGVSEVLIEGGDKEIAVLSAGTMLDHCYSACLKLEENGVNPTLINARFIKPVDQTMIESLSQYRHVFVVEDNVRAGGFGGIVLEKVSECSIINVNIHLLSFPDEFIPQGTREELFRQYGLDSDGIFQSVLKAIQADISTG